MNGIAQTTALTAPCSPCLHRFSKRGGPQSDGGKRTAAGCNGSPAAGGEHAGYIVISHQHFIAPGNIGCRYALLCDRQSWQGVTLPPRQPNVTPPAFGFVQNAELLNSRVAMIGFVILILIEGIFGRGILDMIGMQTGSGIGFEL